MKKITILILLSLIISTLVFTQNCNLVFYTQTGDLFYLYLNGTQQNDSAMSTVKIEDIPTIVYNVKVEFDDIYLDAVEKTIIPNPATETTYLIKKKNNGKYKIWPLTATPLNTPHTSNNPNNNNSNPNDLSVNILGEQFNFNVDDWIVDGLQWDDNGYSNGHRPTGCNQPLDPNTFNQIKQSIASKSFEEDKLTLAKQVTGSNCLYASQVKQIMMLFTYESTKLEFAKFAYHHTHDVNVYYQVNDAFTYTTSVDELNSYIKSLK